MGLSERWSQRKAKKAQVKGVRAAKVDHVKVSWGEVPTSASERPQWVLVLGTSKDLTKSTLRALGHYVFKDTKGGKLTIFKYKEADTAAFRAAFSCDGPNLTFETNVVYRQHHHNTTTHIYIYIYIYGSSDRGRTGKEK